MKWQDHITVDPAILAGKPIVRGTRLAVEYIIDLLGRGWTIDELLEEHDQLSAEDVQASLAYASDVLKSEKLYLTPDA